VVSGGPNEHPAFLDGGGFLAGGQIGFNVNLGGGWISGIEADASWSNAKISENLVEGATTGTIRIRNFETKMNWLASLAFRSGIAADRLWVYGKFGAAVVGERYSSDFLQAFQGTPQSTVNVSGRDTRIGPLFGFGAEYAWAGPWTAKIEYNYIPFADKAVNLTGTQGPAIQPFAVDQRIGQRLHLIKAGINYRFESSEVPVAPAPNARGRARLERGLYRRTGRIRLGPQGMVLGVRIRRPSV
jgi:outer membrane immunogenic protein